MDYISGAWRRECEEYRKLDDLGYKGDDLQFSPRSPVSSSCSAAGAGVRSTAQRVPGAQTPQRIGWPVAGGCHVHCSPTNTNSEVRLG